MSSAAQGSGRDPYYVVAPVELKYGLGWLEVGFRLAVRGGEVMCVGAGGLWRDAGVMRVGMMARS